MKEAIQNEELNAERERMSCGRMVAETKPLSPEGDEDPGSGCSSSTTQTQREVSASHVFSLAAALDKAPSILERPPALTQTLEKPPVTPTSQIKSPSTARALPKTVEKLLVSPPPQEMIPSTIPATSAPPENPQVSPVSHKERGPGTVSATVDLRNSTQERGEVISKQHTMKAKPADQRTEPPLSE